MRHGDEFVVGSRTRDVAVGGDASTWPSVDSHGSILRNAFQINVIPQKLEDVLSIIGIATHSWPMGAHNLEVSNEGTRKAQQFQLGVGQPGIHYLLCVRVQLFRYAKQFTNLPHSLNVAICVPFMHSKGEVGQQCALDEKGLLCDMQKRKC